MASPSFGQALGRPGSDFYAKNIASNRNATRQQSVQRFLEEVSLVDDWSVNSALDVNSFDAVRVGQIVFLTLNATANDGIDAGTALATAPVGWTPVITTTVGGGLDDASAPYIFDASGSISLAALSVVVSDTVTLSVTYLVE